MEHVEMTLEACGKLRQLGIIPHPVPSHRSKEDHGDIDILAVGTEGRHQDIAGVFQAEKSRQNGECLSLLWRGAQLDIVTVREDLVDAAVGYFSWPDLGNFLGRIAKAAGFRYGHRGLARWVGGRGGAKSAALTVSTCTKDIFGFLGVDHRRWEGGFDDPGDIYRFAASSPFFSRRIFEPGAIDHRARVRNRKRPVYAGLLEWSQGRDLPDFDFDSHPEGWWLGRIMDHFGPAWFLERDKWMGEERRRVEAAEKFNGTRVRELTGLDGPELGAFIQRFKERWGVGFLDWVLEQDQPGIDRAVLDFLSGWQGS